MHLMTAAPRRKRSRPAAAKHLTLRNVPPDVMSTLASVANRRGTSQNATAIDLLRRSLGVADQPYDNGLGRYAGDWSERDLQEFTNATLLFEQVDEELWK
jgi:hypothetical protein